MHLGSDFVHHFGIFLLCHNYVFYLFDVITFFDDVRITLYFDMFELRMKITFQLYFVFARHCDVFLLRCNYVIYLFDVVMSFDNVRITLYFGTFELQLEISLQLGYALARHGIAILLRHNDVVSLYHDYVIYMFDVVRFFDNVRITL